MGKHSKHSKHSKGEGAPRRHARLPLWVMIVGMTLLALSFISGLMVWRGQVAAALAADGGEAMAGVFQWRRLHGALNPFMWGLLGYLTHQHFRIGWRNRACLVSGGLMLAVLAGLAMTGTCLVYGGNEMNRATVVSAHKLLGMAVPLVLCAHWIEAILWVKRIEAAALNPTPGD